MTPVYQSQLAFIFDRPLTEPAWYRVAVSEEEDPFGEDPLHAFEFIEQLCQNPALDLAPYSDTQVGNGLTFVFDGSCSNICHDFKEASVSYERRERVLRSLFSLFRDVFNPRCPDRLSAYSQEPSGRLTYICYMFWDVSPLSSWMNFSPMTSLPKDPLGFIQKVRENTSSESLGYYEAIISVMKGCLSLSNYACVESGIHGLGELHFLVPKLTVPVIDWYLKNHSDHSKALLDYARMARSGMIQ